ncbi:DUF222 domain-containing protein [Rhodococcus fascians]|nr:DUF222 domain-containing protein [Rhodococcus fascians]MBY4240678.1 DUF222 domain-containing protein [Rhodococcus fascians]MBY4256377.1 DUF222 domain-containing protein [Rhodococcus fascians]MBY4272083.1 DUF222 domain-containing protein [Rhodococcus fascians]
MAAPVVSLDALITAAREENRHAARKIAACYDFHLTCIAQDAKHRQYSRYGRTEMALALSCSATVAEAYISTGVALHTRLPLLKTAFEAGDIDLPRVRTVCRILDNLSDDIVESVEGDIVEAARRSSPGPLEKEIWDILLRVAPEEAAALREFAKRFRNVSYAPAGELARIRAELTAPEAAAAWQLLEEMADTVCVKDPRGKQERLCDAFMARMHGEPRLTCLCQRADCPKKNAQLPDRRVPLTMITVDIATLIGLLANPAYLAGHGSIDPDLARELARNSQWQILLTEAVTLAETLGPAVQNPETGEWERRSAESTDTTAQPNTTDPEPAQPNSAESHATTDTAPPEPTADDDTQDRQQRRNALASAAALFCTHTPVGRGSRHSSALDLPSMIRSNRRMFHTPAGIYLGNASLAAALEAAIAADPTLGKSVGRDPLTDRALIYRPDALTTAAVRLRDRHCRFPGCHRPAARCQLDHVIPFDHANPLGGGWTTVNNLQCLCEYHHSVKTAGYWTAVMLPGGAILWTSASKTTRITLPANGTTVPIIGNDLRPHIPTQPRRSGVIAYPDPPDNPTPEPSDEEADTAPPF